MNELLAIPISPREIVVTSTGWSDLRWVEVSFAHVIDMEFNHVYRTEFKSKNDIEWTVQYRFKHYRSLHHALETQGVILEAPFPRTYLRSSFGFALGIGQLRRRASRLHAWIIELISKYGTLDESSAEMVSHIFDASQAEGETKSLKKLYSYIDYMSKAYSETHIRDPSIDLVNKFKSDLEQARSTSTRLSSLPIKTFVGDSEDELKDRSITGAPSMSSESSRGYGLGRSTVV